MEVGKEEVVLERKERDSRRIGQFVRRFRPVDDTTLSVISSNQ